MMAELARDALALVETDEACARLIGAAALRALRDAAAASRPSGATPVMTPTTSSSRTRLKAWLIASNGDELRKCRSSRSVLAQLAAAMATKDRNVIATIPLPDELTRTSFCELLEAIHGECLATKARIFQRKASGTGAMLKLSARDPNALELASKRAAGLIGTLLLRPPLTDGPAIAGGPKRPRLHR